MAETEVGDVRGLEGFYHYRQYSAVELADKRSLEDVWFLLFEGHLPTAAESRAFLDEIRALRPVPEAVRALLPAIATLGRPAHGPAAQRRVARSATARASGRGSTSTATSCGPTPCRCARWSRR